MWPASLCLLASNFVNSLGLLTISILSKSYILVKSFDLSPLSFILECLRFDRFVRLFNQFI